MEKDFGTDESPKYKKSLGSIILLIFLAGLVVYCLISGIAELTKPVRSLEASLGSLEKGECVEGVADCGTDFPILTMTHTINFIPTLKEYYYMVGDGEYFAIVRAGKDFGDTFDPDTNENLRDTKIKGIVRSLDGEARIKIDQHLSSSGLSEYTNSMYYIDTYGQRIAVIKVIVAALSFVLTFMIVKMLRKKKESEFDDLSSKSLSKAYGVVVSVGVILLAILGVYISMML